jgi:alkanesulfonate monooxygenase SsuD/methylene tetrahydromethanopterin reductase-like flavin-dependent oxidoreductase (luciferase family)
MPPLRFGILSLARAPYEDLSHIWRSVDDLGFDSAWVNDDLNTSGWAADFEAWSLLGALARETTRLRIGTLVTVVTFRHPALLAGQVTTIDHISGGRVELGIGAGGPENQYPMLGLEEWPPKERVDRLVEQVVSLDGLLRGGTIHFEGHYYRSDAPTMPTPVQKPRPPIIIAAHGERGLRLAAQYADGWNSLGGQPYRLARDPIKRRTLVEAVAETRRLSEQLDIICHEVGRDPSTLRRSIATYWPATEPLSSIDAFDEYVGRYREIGIDEIIFYWPTLENFSMNRPLSREQWAMLEHIASERMPEYRREEFK